MTGKRALYDIQRLRGLAGLLQLLVRVKDVERILHDRVDVVVRAIRNYLREGVVE